VSSVAPHIVVPWYRGEQVAEFLRAWGVDRDALPPWLVLQQDERREGCAVTKNKGVEEAMARGAEVVVVLDDDCFPCEPERSTLERFAEAHVEALLPRSVRMFEAVTTPPSRGTPFGKHSFEMPTAASMGFWTEVGDYCGVRQLAFGAPPMEFRMEPIFGRYFPLCGMNLAFRPRDWLPWCRFVDVPRFDDIWMGWLWQREAYRRGSCFNLGGPLVRHSRQSDPWRNLIVEARHLKANETLWANIAQSPHDDYATLSSLLPKDAGGTDR
jgi:hypothetical protein